MMDRVERLLGKECYIIDYLPMTVEREGKGQFFEVEEYLLGSEGYRGIRRRFGAVVLKLMCYFHVWVFLGEWIDRPSPELVERAVWGIVEGSASFGEDHLVGGFILEGGKDGLKVRGLEAELIPT